MTRANTGAGIGIVSDGSQEQRREERAMEERLRERERRRSESANQ